VLRAHETVAVLVLVAAGLAVAFGAVAYARGGTAAGAARHLLALVQTLLVAQVGLGLLLLSDDRRAPDELHYAYGTLSLAAVLAPWLYAPIEPRRRLAWFVGATLVAGLLAGRAYMTAA
jgi:hypothetical protein